MRSGAVISLSVALALGLAAALLTRSLVAGRSGNEARAAAPQTIVVAAQTVGFGTTLSAENLREVPWLGEARIEGAFASVAVLNRDGRRIALSALQRNEPVLAAKITAPNQRATLSTQIDEGMRAVSVRVDEVRGVAGFILPGDRVDVILTRGETSAQDAAAAYADVLLQNAKVLAIDQSAHERPDKPAIARAVTLELNVQQAQSIILAQGIGRLSLVLRQTGETGTPPAGRVTAADIGSTAAAVAVAPARNPGLEQQLAEMRRVADQANASAGDSARRLAEVELRLREEIMRARLPPSPPASIATAPQPAPRSTETIVTVVRNGAKREQYSVFAEP